MLSILKKTNYTLGILLNRLI